MPPGDWAVLPWKRPLDVASRWSPGAHHETGSLGMSSPRLTTPVALPAEEPIFIGGGEMGDLTRAFPWSETEVGAMHTWPPALRTMVGVLLGSRHPMFLWWGPGLIQFYNDAYRPSLGRGKHPRALGQAGRECWPEIWDVIGPQIDAVMLRGESTWHEDQLIPIERNGTLQDVYWTYGYSPVRDDRGAVGGVLVVVTDTTSRVIGERRTHAAPPPRRLRRGRDLGRRALHACRGRPVIGPVRHAVLPGLPPRYDGTMRPTGVEGRRAHGSGHEPRPDLARPR